MQWCSVHNSHAHLPPLFKRNRFNVNSSILTNKRKYIKEVWWPRGRKAISLSGCLLKIKNLNWTELNWIHSITKRLQVERDVISVLSPLLSPCDLSSIYRVLFKTCYNCSVIQYVWSYNMPLVQYHKSITCIPKQFQFFECRGHSCLYTEHFASLITLILWNVYSSYFILKFENKRKNEATRRSLSQKVKRQPTSDFLLYDFWQNI